MCKQLVYYPLVKNTNGKQKILFNHCVDILKRDDVDEMLKIQELTKKFYEDNTATQFVKMVSIPCGCCSECLKARSRTWAFRIMKEASQYENNYFITLTYADECLESPSLIKDEISKFNKKLRTYLKRKGLKDSFRYYGVGEYGEKFYRPHYHIIYFDLDIPDLKYEFKDSNGHLHFSSEFLKSVWSKGNIDIGAVEIGSACYVARYCDKKKKLTKFEKEKFINMGFVPEFSVMSRRPGIGGAFFDEIVQKFKAGKYTEFFKGNQFNLNFSQYYTAKIKELLTPDELKSYENQSRLNSNLKISQFVQMSDFVDMESLFKSEEQYYHTNRKL